MAEAVWIRREDRRGGNSPHIVNGYVAAILFLRDIPSGDAANKQVDCPANQPPVCLHQSLPFTQFHGPGLDCRAQGVNVPPSRPMVTRLGGRQWMNRGSEQRGRIRLPLPGPNMGLWRFAPAGRVGALASPKSRNIERACKAAQPEISASSRGWARSMVEYPDGGLKGLLRRPRSPSGWRPGAAD
jgi:hypothetical protein